MAESIVCAVCNHVNKATDARCQACGAKLEALTVVEASGDDAHAHRHHQDRFDWKWVGIALAIYLPLCAIAIVVLPMVVSTYDPQGLWGLLISGTVWFVGGVVVGYLSPGRTFIEPSVAAAIMSIPTVYWLNSTSTVYQVSIGMYFAAAVLGVLATVLGSFTGERFQGDARR
jgi:hypothetical protein